VGRALHSALEAEAKKRSIAELRTRATWRDHAMLKFLDSAGYALAPSEVLECAVNGSRLGAGEAAVASPARDKPGDPNDWSAPSANDYEQLARDTAEIRLLSAKDLEDVVRIDRDFTGRERRAYMQHALDEALRESGVRISLAAVRDGHAVGFVMARADLGDFGRTEPVAVIDTLGVAPAHAHHGTGHALLSQLFLNLGALRIERVETVVATRNVELLGFFHSAGFARGQRLAFLKQIGN
jgi:ribosomal protein S18 acetylase RimI-like enzyme